MKALVTSVFFSATGMLALAGCTADDPPTKKETPRQPAQAAASKKVEVGKNVFVEIQGEQRRVLVESYVCLRKGQLEQFLTRKRTKEHEAILAADLDARDIHKALLLANAEPGAPVQFFDQKTMTAKYVPARGHVIKVSVEYTDGQGQTQRHAAQKWIRSFKTKKDLEHDWVFAGSVLFPNPEDATKPPFYMANDGDVICVSNFETAMLDLPIKSPKDNDDLAFEANTERIPPLETRVLIILEPAPAKAKDKK
jgi:hypothetical protein